MFFHREHFFKSVQGQKIGDCQLQRGGVTEPGRDPEEPLRRSPRASLIREDTQCPRDPNEGRPPSSSTSTVPLTPHMGLETGPSGPVPPLAQMSQATRGRKSVVSTHWNLRSCLNM